MQNKKAPVIAVTNRKGGVGKTTMAVHLAAGLAALGKRVMLVDADSQGQCALLLNLPEMNGLYEMVVNGAEPSEVVLPVPPEVYALPDTSSNAALYLLPGSNQTYQIADHIGEDAISNLFASLTQLYDLDVIIVDTQPSISKMDAALWLAVDYFLYVTTLDRLGVAGLQSAIEQLIGFNPNRTLRGLPATQVIGIVPNRVEKRMVVNETVGNELTAAYQHLVWPPVLERQAWPRAAQIGRMVYKYSHGQAVQDCWNMVWKVMGVIGG